MNDVLKIKEPWRFEFDKTALRYHKITLWVAIIFNLLFFIPDYFILNDYWKEFLSVRITVSLICLMTVLFYKKLNISIQLMGVIPVLLISLENAYMWSVMDLEQLQAHTLSYIALFIGSGMFVLYKVSYSVFVVLISLIINIILFYSNSTLGFEQIMANGAFLVLSVAIFSILLIKTRLNLTRKELIARFALEASKQELQEKNKEIVDSINYANRIQKALIPPVEVFKKILPDSFILFKPKDIVSGDFYWISELSTTKKKEPKEKLIVVTVADCTGHGVSGAFMSLIGLKILNQSVKEKYINTPGEALDFLNKEVYRTVNKHTGEGTIIRDGMDIAFCSINLMTLKLNYAGAKNPVYIVRHKELIEIKGNKKPIGSYETTEAFTTHEFQLEKNDMVYLFSDGFADQFGGPKGKKLKYKPFKNTLIENSDKSLDEQYDQLNNLFENWKGDLEQLDDVCVIGIKI